jgi:hypothetical protein
MTETTYPRTYARMYNALPRARVMSFSLNRIMNKCANSSGNRRLCLEAVKGLVDSCCRLDASMQECDIAACRLKQRCKANA